MTEQPTTDDGHAARDIAIVAPPRLPYHPAIEERFGVDKAQWKALVEAIYPAAKTTDGVILALSYCKARKLDPFKRPVHIVPIWDDVKKKMVESVWPGINELRTTAFRTGQYGGRNEAAFGPVMKETVGKVEMEYPEWCQVTVYRMLGGERLPFPGPRVYWRETYAKRKRDDYSPNSMWQQRPYGQLDKCAEAAALRAAFPEEVGNEYTLDEAPRVRDMGNLEPDASGAYAPVPRPRRADSSEPKEDAYDEPLYTLIDEVGEVIGENMTPAEFSDGWCAHYTAAAPDEQFIENNADEVERLKGSKHAAGCYGPIAGLLEASEITEGDQSEETQQGKDAGADAQPGAAKAADGAGETPAAPPRAGPEDQPADRAKWKAPHWREWSKRSIADIADYDDEGELRAWFDADVAPACKANMDASRNEGAAVLDAYNERLAVLQGEAVGADG